MMKYPRSPKALLGGTAHLGRFIDKIRLRHAGKIQDYNYITVGHDKHLVDFLQIDPKSFEQRVLAGGTDEAFLAWVKANCRKPSDQEIAQWSQGLLSSGPKVETKGSGMFFTRRSLANDPVVLPHFMSAVRLPLKIKSSSRFTIHPSRAEGSASRPPRPVLVVYGLSGSSGYLVNQITKINQTHKRNQLGFTLHEVRAHL